jgi:hypothetical protein
MKEPIKVNVNLTLEQNTNAQRVVEVYLYSFSKLCARCLWVVNATPRPLYTRERPGTHCVPGWVAPRTGLQRCVLSRSPP